MHKLLKSLVDERNALTGLMTQLADTAADEDRDLTEPEQERMRGWQTRCAVIDSEAAEQNGYLESQRAWAKLQEQLKSAQPDPAPVSQQRSGGAHISTPESGWGEQFTRSAAFANYPGHGMGQRVELAGIFDIDQRAAIDSTWMQVPPYQHTPQLWKMTTPLLDAISREKVSTGAIEWYTFPGSYPLAQVVAEGQLKPEANLTPTLHTASLNTYAHFKGITRQALEDIPRVQTIIENALRGGILLKLEADTAAVLAADTDIEDLPADDMLSGIRVAIGEVQANGYANPNIILMNPADLANVDIGIMSGTLGGPAVNGSLWGIRTVAVGAVPVGTAYVGDAKAAITLFDRGATSVYLTDSHADYFLRNTLVVLAETRALPAVTEAQAIIRVGVTVIP